MLLNSKCDNECGKDLLFLSACNGPSELNTVVSYVQILVCKGNSHKIPQCEEEKTDYCMRTSVILRSGLFSCLTCVCPPLPTYA